MPNELKIGTRRTGNLIDFDPATPEVQVTLDRTEQGISLTVPWSEPTSRYARWFLSDSVSFGDDDVEPVPVPKRLLFQDSHGAVLLVNTWAQGFHAAMFGPGSGTVWAQYAVLGVQEDIDFASVDGMRTEVSGLRAWMNVTSWTARFQPRQEPRYQVESLNVPAIEVGDHRSSTLRLVPDWLVPSDEEDRIVLHDILFAETRTATPASWPDHLAVHEAIRDLLTLSRWRKESCVISRVTIRQDVLRTLDGAEHGEQWRQVVARHDQRTAAPTGYRPHLIQFEEIGVEGIARWLRLRDDFARALDPVLSSLELVGGSPFTMLAQVGPGLEALGYLLFVEDGLSDKIAAGKTLRHRFERILVDVAAVLPFDSSGWGAKAAEIYNGLKHANRASPADVDLLNGWREDVLIIRAWVALRLGVDSRAVRDRLEQDPQRHPFVQRA